jgi:CrcB protein
VSLALALGVGLVGGLGSIGRLLLDGAISGRSAGKLPYGTFVVNISGALVLGALVGAAVGHDAYRLAGTGLLGAFTTFSTWALESHRLGEDGELRLGALNLAISLILGLVAVWAGQHLGGWL